MYQANSKQSSHHLQTEHALPNEENDFILRSGFFKDFNKILPTTLIVINYYIRHFSYF